MAVASYILPRFKAIDDYGRPMVGAKLYTYQNNTTTPAATYQDAQQSAANTNPIVLDASGEAIVYLLRDQIYTFVLKDKDDVSVWTQNDVTGAASAQDIDGFKEDLSGSSGSSLIGFLQDGGGAVARTLQSKGRDIVNVMDYGATGDGVTDDQAAIAAAVGFCFTSGAALEWKQGTYVSTESIPNLHSVRHIGPGVIKRGAVLFHPDPKGNEANVLYVKAPGGAVDGDGITPDFPLTNLQAALDVLMFRGYVDGAWTIDSPAGTYSGENATGHLGHRNEALPPTGAYFRDGVFLRNALLIKGADVGYHPVTNPEPVPTTIFNGAGISNGLHLEDTDQVVIRDIKFLNYTNSGGSGILSDNTDIRTENVHTENCWFGISGLNYVRLEIKGGVIYGNTNTALSRTGIRALFQCKLEIGNQLAGARGQGPRIEANRIGLLAQEGTTGHADFVTFANNGVGLRIPSRSRVNCTGSSFARHLQAIRADTNSDVFYNPGSVEFFTGTADANTENVIVQTGAICSGDEIDTYANMGLATDYLNTPYVLTGTTASTPILVKTLQRGYFAPVPTSARKPILIEVVGHGTFTGTGGTKQIKMRMGGSLIGATTTDAGITGPFQFHWVGMLRSPTSQSGSIAVLTHLNPTRVNSANLAIDMNAADVPLQFEAQLANAGDTITIESCVFKTWG